MATVEVIIDKAGSVAERLSGQADDLLRSAVSAASASITLNPVTVGDPGEATEQDLSFTIPEPTAQYNAPGNSSEKPVYDTLTTVSEDIEYPELDPPLLDELFNYNAPSFANLGSFNKQAPNLDTQGIEDAIDAVPVPTLTDIEEPKLSDVEVGAVPDVTLPEFAPTVTIGELAPPPDLCEKFRTQYDAALPQMRSLIDDTMAQWNAEYAPELPDSMARLEARLEEGVMTGKALSEEFEVALYERARTRAESERERMENELTDGVAKRGFSLPPGIVNAGRSRLHQATADNISAQAIELAIERAKMEIAHTEFAMQLSQGVNQMLISAAMQYAQHMLSANQQAIDFARQAAQSSAQAYELLIRKASLNIDVLKAQAMVYETELKAALSVYEQFRMTLETAKLQTDIDLAQVTLFTRKIEAQSTKIAQYAAMLDGVKTRAELEKIKAELYGEEVRAYVAMLSGVQAEVQVYSAALQGDESKMRGELAKVDIFAKEVEAVKIQESVKVERIRAAISSNQNKVSQYQASIQAYQVEVAAEVQRFRAENMTTELALKTVQTEMEVKRDVYAAEYEAISSRADIMSKQAEADIESRRTAKDLFLSRTELLADTNKSVGLIYGNMASSALSSHNTMVSRVLSTSE